MRNGCLVGMAFVLVAAVVMFGCGSSKPINPAGAGGSAAGPDGASEAADNGGAGGGTETGGGHALRFDGVNDQIVFPTGGASEQSYTAEVWFRSTVTTGMLVEVFSTNGADRSLYLKDGSVCFYVFTPAYSETCSTSTTLNDGTWHHAAGVLGAGGQNLYVDGAPARSATAVTSSAFVTDTKLRAGYGYIGPNGPRVYFAGDLDEIRLWNVERTASEIATARATNIDPATAGLQGYWKLDGEGTLSAARDATPNGYDGPLTGFALNPSPWVTPGAF